jgi:GTP-binding protein HflX
MIKISPKEKERAILVGISSKNITTEKVFSSLDELELLVLTAGGEVLSKIIQNKDRIDPAFYIGKGKAQYIAEISEQENIDTIVFDEDLSPVQIRNLENLIDRKIIDRSSVILDIFASHAKTLEAKTQVELAQLEYLLPRLTRRWTHLSKQYGGIGTKGPGETQIETDRRVIRKKISFLKEKLETITRQKKTQRKLRSKLPRIAMVGYTNVGKSTILNLLSGAEVLTEDKLFSTLDTTVRQINVSPSRKFLISDTVGFINKLPHHLFVSFMSTLSEVVESDLLLHVVDITNANAEEQISVVKHTLEELNCNDKPAILVFNKIDALKHREQIGHYKNKYSDAVFVSALRGINVGTLIDKILKVISYDLKEYIVKLNIYEHKMVSQIHLLAEVTEKKYEEDGIFLRFRATEHNYKKICDIISIE